MFVFSEWYYGRFLISSIPNMAIAMSIAIPMPTTAYRMGVLSAITCGCSDDAGVAGAAVTSIAVSASEE